jgi:predicted  nucleic acid-binding Zn-ribbon protein
VKEIKTNKEYQAHLKEIESVEKERAQIEDEILVIMEEMESVSQKVEKERNSMKQGKEKVDSMKNELDQQKMQSEAEMNKKMEIRSHIAASINEDLYREYINLFESRSGSAVIEAKAEICQGCNMNIPPQLFVEVKRNERIIHCPQCQRILFFKNEV